MDLELVSTKDPESKVPTVLAAIEKALVSVRLAMAWIVLLLAKVTVPVPSAKLLLRAKAPALRVVPPLYVLLDVRTVVPAPALISAPTPEITPELVRVKAPESITPLVVRATLLVTFRLASAFSVVLMLAKVTVPAPSA